MNSSSSHLYEEIAESLRRKIARGDLKPRDRLPTVRELAREWGCTTGTVNRAYTLLAEEGLLSSHRGSGTRVTDSPLPPESDAVAWGALVNQAERFLLEVLGQGYTPAQAQTAVSVALSRWQSLQMSLPRAAVPTTSDKRLNFVGSHDMTMELLAQQFTSAAPGCDLQLNFRGSLGGLIALARHEADLAGIHLWDEPSDTYNLPFVRRVLPGQRVALLTVAKRSIGLLVPPGNPAGIASLSDLTDRKVHYINRQGGSGTRVWFDAQLQLQEIDPQRISGYKNEKATHLQVAQAIKDKQATAGLGLQAAAVAYELSFVPLTEELYQLVIPERVWATAICQQLAATVHAPVFSAAIETLIGYDNTHTGELIWLN